MLFLGSQIQGLSSLSRLPFFGGYIGIMGVFAGVVLHFISLIFIIMMISTLQVKQSNGRGTPIPLSGKYKDMLDTFKINMITVFMLIFILLLIVFNSDKITSVIIVQNAISVSMLLLSCSIIGLSSWNVSISNEFSKLQYRQIIT